MRVLTDTHTLVWALSKPELLSPQALKAISTSEVVASVASLWELSLKAGKKDALLADPIPWWQKYVLRRIPTLGIRVKHVIALAQLPEIHKDPFDRILVAQSLVGKMPLITKDAALARYGIDIIW